MIFISDAISEGAAAAPGGEGLPLLLIGMFVIMYRWCFLFDQFDLRFLANGIDGKSGTLYGQFVQIWLVRGE